MDILDELTDLLGAPPHEVKAVADRAIKEIDRLREALKDIIDNSDPTYTYARLRAAAALKESE